MEQTSPMKDADPRTSPENGDEPAVSVTPTVWWFDSDGGSGSINVVAPGDAKWTTTVTSAASEWLTIKGPASGTGSGQIAYLVAPNAVASRAGSIDVNVAVPGTAGQDTRVRILELAPPFWFEQIVLSTPLPVIEQTALLGFLKQISKLPPPARLAATVALLGGIAAAGTMAEGLYVQYPSVPQKYTPLFITHEVQEAVQFVLTHPNG